MSTLKMWQPSCTLRLGLPLALGLCLTIGLLLAMGALHPHYAVLAALAGWGAGNFGAAGAPFIGLLCVLLVIVAILLLLTGKYHRDIFQLVMGINLQFMGK